MTATQGKDKGTKRLIDSIDHAEHVSLEAVRNFLDTVDSAFPDLAGNDRPRRKIIDSAFKMTEQLVGSSTRLAQNILDVAERTLTDSDRTSASSTK
jgi:hypothetical protein